MDLFRAFSLFFIIVSSLFSSDLIVPIHSVEVNKEKAQLGKMLFFETRLSSDNTISCASCHDTTKSGADSTSISLGVDGKKGDRNSPTVFNAVFNFSQFWDGRAKTLQEQAIMPIHNPVEMNSNFKQIISKLKEDPFYLPKFKKLYSNWITGENIVDAISEYEKTLITPDSKFDKYLKGEKNILSHDEKEGYELFKDYGCISCHNGINIGGNVYQKIGIMKEYSSKDKGRFEITGDKNDLYFFKVPTLRNIELTAPYFHDGSAKDLESAVKTMSEYQLGYPLTNDEIKKLVAFLKTLTGNLPKEALYE